MTHGYEMHIVHQRCERLDTLHDRVLGGCSCASFSGTHNLRWAGFDSGCGDWSDPSRHRTGCLGSEVGPSKLLTDRPRNDARRGATAFAVSAPLALGVGYLLGELAGGYAEVILGRYFVLPAIMTFIIILMIFLPSGVVMWALHPTGGVGSASESEQNEHC